MTRFAGKSVQNVYIQFPLNTDWNQRAKFLRSRGTNLALEIDDVCEITNLFKD